MPSPYIPVFLHPLPTARVSSETVELVQEYLAQTAPPGPGPAARKRGLAMERLILAGFASLRRADDLRELADVAGRVRAVLRELGEIDMSDAPCPPKADPKWWSWKQAQERAQAQEQFRAALAEADKLTLQLQELAANLKKGDAR